MDVKQIAARALGRGILLGKKHSPEILTITGIAGLVTAGVLAAQSTLKLEDIVEEHKDRIRGLRSDWDEIINHSSEVQVKEYKRDVLYVYRNTSWQLAKAYGPAITLAAASAVGILAGQNILKKRNLALVGAYKALESSFSEYRKRVVEEYGEQTDKDILMGVRRSQVTGEDGKTTEVATVSSDRHSASPYARFFDETNENWDPNADYNIMHLKNWQNWANDLLRVRGHVFLNEVYDMLGMEHSTPGAVVGWVISKDGDNFIDFGIFEQRNSTALNHTSSRADNVFFLDFNVDGIIYDKI